MSTNGELRKFRAHEELLAKVIKDQTGGVDRAILEAVQNSIDAGATEVHITTSLSRLIIADLGKGFASKEEIVNNFETFGRPHEAREAKQFGAFRMGRGQLMPHGACSWTSNQWKMSVDLNKDGLAYRLEELDEPQPGCTVKVDLYRPLSNYDLTRLRADLKRDVKYVEAKVFLDNERISQGAREGKWPVEGDWFVGHFNLTGDLHLYNVGVHVATWPNSKYGVGGTVVTNLAMRLNTARNDPKDDCPVWTEAKEAMLKERARLLEELEASGRPKKKKSSSGKKTSTRKHLSVDERQRRLRKIFAGQVTVERDDLSEPYFYAPVEKTKWVSALWLHKACLKHCPARHVVVTEYKRELAVKANEFKLFYVLDTRNCSLTGIEQENLVDGLNRLFDSCRAPLFKFLSHEKAWDAVAKHVEVLERRKLTAQEEILVSALTDHLRLNFHDQSCGHLGVRYHVGLFDKSTSLPVRVLDGKGPYDRPELQVVLHKERLTRLASLGLHGWLTLADTIVSQIVDHAAEIVKPEAPREWRAAEYHEAMQSFISSGLLNILHALAESQREGVEELKLSHARALDVLAMFDESGRSLDLWKSKLLEVKGELEKALRNNSLEGDPLALIARERGAVLAASES